MTRQEVITKERGLTGLDELLDGATQGRPIKDVEAATLAAVGTGRLDGLCRVAARLRDLGKGTTVTLKFA